jgi:hypothetical protein
VLLALARLLLLLLLSLVLGLLGSGQLPLLDG